MLFVRSIHWFYRWVILFQGNLQLATLGEVSLPTSFFTSTKLESNTLLQGIESSTTQINDLLVDILVISLLRLGYSNNLTMHE